MTDEISLSCTEQIVLGITASIIWIGISAICLISMLKNGSDEPIMIFAYVDASVFIGLISSFLITLHIGI